MYLLFIYLFIHWYIIYFNSVISNYIFVSDIKNIDTTIDLIRKSQNVLLHIPQCSIQNRNVHISVLNEALWDMEQVHSGICEIGLKQKSSSWHWLLRQPMECISCRSHKMITIPRVYSIKYGWSGQL